MSATGSAVTKIKGGVTAALGFRASGVKAGIKKSGGYDMGLIVSDVPAHGAGCFTTNKVRAFCVDWCASLLPSSNIRAMLMNSGNANACTGKAGEDDARKLARETASVLGCKDTNILMASTGVIGHRMPLAPMIKALPQLCKELSAQGGARFATTIMTTDTVSKELNRILSDTNYRETMLAGYAEVLEELGGPGCAERAADLMINLLKRK